MHPDGGRHPGDPDLPGLVLVSHRRPLCRRRPGAAGIRSVRSGGRAAGALHLRAAVPADPVRAGRQPGDPHRRRRRAAGGHRRRALCPPGRCGAGILKKFSLVPAAGLRYNRGNPIFPSGGVCNGPIPFSSAAPAAFHRRSAGCGGPSSVRRTDFPADPFRQQAAFGAHFPQNRYVPLGRG